MNAGIAERRLLNQRLTRPELRRPADVIAWLGAVQAQEYRAGEMGARSAHAGAARPYADIQHAFDQGRILRTHVMRPTWHFVTPADIRWLLELTAPRVHRVMTPYNRRLGLDAAMVTRGTSIIERALADRHYLTRSELGDQLRHIRSCARQHAARASGDARRARGGHLQRPPPRQTVHLCAHCRTGAQSDAPATRRSTRRC